MRYLLFAVLGMLLACACDGGSSNEPPWGFGNAGPVVDFSAGCGDREIWCADDDDITWYYDEKDIPKSICAWDCAIYTGNEKVVSFYNVEGPAAYMVSFKQKADGCWELDTINKTKPRC